ncbi:MAG: chemotaxis protein CheW [Bdellovibrionota bacterium]|nr:chemotaxis protein CheW [Pseudobdellovibrionaceae bacterium]|tara:strand:+ start:23869 stop:24318 length:450 start_codon:yes stop_codon:yes gene_type:complete
MESEVLNTENVQYCTFQIGEDFFGVDVLKVQEVIKPLQLTEIPKSDEVVCGLMNLRGNIVTQISLRRLFGLQENEDNEHMNVIVNTSDGLLSLKVDQIDDVQSLNMSSFETTPDTLDVKIRKYVKGIHKLDGRLLVVLDLEEIEGFAGE